MPMATGLIETSSALRFLQQLSKDFGQEAADGDREVCAEAAMPGGGIARMKADAQGLTVTLLSDDPAVIALSKRLIEGYIANCPFRDQLDHVEWVDRDGPVASFSDA
ncbi:hypothetical protein LJR030_003884 [Rhizobium sp. LjRoot30]|uniref:hypothetical protein n=1 Tax=Rhizobium sp. LjRoot30 TaxID=3342320 RepID=UPI003ECC69AA